jgi:D-methionine transport system substrate-binding protein
MKQFFNSTLFIFASLLLLLTSCGKSSHPTLKVAATSVPHAEILEFIQPQLKEQNIALEILIIDDFNTPNRALADGEVDANFFQHLPFLEAQKADFGYKLEPLVAVHVEPMALYSKEHSSLAELPERATIAIPSDASNQARALALFEQVGLIQLESKGAKTSLLDIASNPHRLRFIEMDSPLLSRSLDDVDAAAISTNFALLAGLSPKKDALAIENGQSRFANIVVVRAGESQRPELQALKAALTTEQVRHFIEERYQGAVIPAF